MDYEWIIHLLGYHQFCRLPLFLITTSVGITNSKILGTSNLLGCPILPAPSPNKLHQPTKQPSRPSSISADHSDVGLKTRLTTKTSSPDQQEEWIGFRGKESETSWDFAMYVSMYASIHMYILCTITLHIVYNYTLHIFVYIHVYISKYMYCIYNINTLCIAYTHNYTYTENMRFKLTRHVAFSPETIYIPT